MALSIPLMACALFISLIGLLAQLYFLHSKYSKLRLAAFFASISTTCLLILNLLRGMNYFEYLYWLFWGLSSAFNIDLIIWILMDIGKAFYTPGTRFHTFSQWLRWWVIIATTIYTAFSVAFGIYITVQQAYTDLTIALLRTYIVIAYVSTVGAIMYIFMPLMVTKGIRDDGETDASVIGIWYTLVLFMASVPDGALWIYAIAHDGVGLIDPDYQTLDCVCRIFLFLTYSIPCPRGAIRRFRKYFVQLPHPLGYSRSMSPWPSLGTYPNPSNLSATSPRHTKTGSVELNSYTWTSESASGL